MLAKSLKYNEHIMMVRSDDVYFAPSGGETASAKRRQRSMQAAGGVTVLLKLIQPRQREITNGDVFSVTEASTEGAQLVCSGWFVGVQKTVACMQGSARELGRPVGFLLGGSDAATKGRVSR
jgi:hypothetical protein